MPRNVKIFLALSYLSMITGLAYTGLNFSKVAAVTAQLGHGKVGGANFVIASLAITDAILLTIISLAGFRRQNWARWTLLVFFALGSLIELPMLFMTTERYPFEHIEQAVLTLLQAAALFFVFTGDARDWFRRGAAPAA